jgi:flagella basal body P-ring formation protein FlgA
MTSFAELMLFVALAGTPATASAAPADAPRARAETPAAGAIASSATVVPDEWALAVAGRIAERWNVDPGLPVLEWGRAPARWPDRGTPFELAGAGADGWFTVVFRPGGRDAEAMRLRAGLAETTWVAARALAAGEHLVDADAVPAIVTRWGAPTAETSRAPEPGSLVRRPLAAGAPLLRPAIAPPALIEAGTPVRLEWTSGGVRVALDGVALNSASRGEPVRARVQGRGRVVGVASGPGVATLNPGGAP